MTTAVVDSVSAAQVRTALIAELRTEAKLVAAVDADALVAQVSRLVDHGISVSLANRKILQPDMNGVTRLEAALQRAVSEVLMRELWPQVAAAYALGAGWTTAKAAPVDDVDYDGLVELYDSIHARLSREAIHGAAWRIATRALDAARRASRG